MTGVKRRVAPLGQRFWSKVDQRGPNECWPWKAGFYTNGYGSFTWSTTRRHASAHRVAWTLTHGDGEYPPSDWVIMHKCDNPACCNPSHLLRGTFKDNTRDMIGKGRQKWVIPLGEEHGRAVLNETSVREIRASSDLLRVLAERYGVSCNQIHMVKKRKAWRHVS